MRLKTYHLTIAIWSGTIASHLLSVNPLQAQITPSDIDGINSPTFRTQQVDGRQTTVISEGVDRGGNLFHIFDEFNLLTGEQVLFLNDVGANRVFSLVIGETPSDIDGTLGILGPGDLIFANSNGINFGLNAVLDIQGNFIGTTAERLEFSDGQVLSLRGDGFLPLFSSSIPAGLGFSSQSQGITVENTGHRLAGSGILPYLEQTPSLGLQATEGSGLALIGSEINLDGGILRTIDGPIKLSAVEDGTVSIGYNSSLRLDHSSEVAFGDITATNAALIESGGLRGGDTTLTGSDVSFNERAVIIANSSISNSDGVISIVADRLRIDGDTVSLLQLPNDPTLPVEVLPASIISQSFGESGGTDIDVEAEQLYIVRGGGITARGFQGGSPGDISISSDIIRIEGSQPQIEVLLSTINTLSFSDVEDSGRIAIDADNIQFLDGALIASSSFGAGQGGEIEINADAITVSGTTGVSQIPTTVQSSSFSLFSFNEGSNGDAGNISINASRLQVLEGGRISSKASGTGSTGIVSIDADEQVLVSSSSLTSQSLISSSIREEADSVETILGLTGDLQGNTGNVVIRTPSLVIGEGGSVSVENNGIGDSGRILIDANRIRQLDSGSISAFTASGEGGNIDVTADSILLTDDSNINASSAGNRSGGNIFISSDVIALADDSRIRADASNGPGGRVVIEADTLLRSPNSSITATSELGPELDGLVDVQVPDSSSRIEVDVELSTSEVPTVVAACATGTASGDTFTVAGRGGLPVSNLDGVQLPSGWNEPSRPMNSVTSDSLTRSNHNRIVEAQGWIPNGDGTVRFSNSTTNLSNSDRRRSACLSGRDT